MRLGFLLLSVIAVLAGCATPVPPTSKIESLIVVSAVGDRLRLVEQSIPYVVDKEDVVVDWKIDDHIRKIVADSLRGRYTVHDVAYSQAYMDDVAWKKTPAGNPAKARVVLAALRTFVPAGTADAIVYVAVASTVSNNVGRGATRVQGIGLSILGLFAKSLFVFTAYEIMVFDGRTFEMIGEAAVARPHLRPVSWQWPGSYKDIPEDHRQDVKKVAFDMLGVNIPATLTTLGLIK